MKQLFKFLLSFFPAETYYNLFVLIAVSLSFPVFFLRSQGICFNLRSMKSISLVVPH